MAPCASAPYMQASALSEADGRICAPDAVTMLA